MLLQTSYVKTVWTDDDEIIIIIIIIIMKILTQLYFLDALQFKNSTTGCNNKICEWKKRKSNYFNPFLRNFKSGTGHQWLSHYNDINIYIYLYGITKAAKFGP